MHKINLIAEIGINHNGDLNVARKLINVAALAGFDYVKFQKRNPDICVPEDQKNKIKILEDGTEVTYLEYKHRIEFTCEEYDKIDDYCSEAGIKWFPSVWDIDSADEMRFFTNMVKIPSALITDLKLLECCRAFYPKILISTGMSTEEEIEQAIKVGNPDVIMHCNSSYPTDVNELNFGYIKWLQEKYPTKQIGFSSHEFGLATTFAAAGAGVTWIEKHITLNRSMWGSDQSSSVEPVGLFKLVKGIRDIEKALNSGYEERKVFNSEIEKRKVLRK
jgi:N-acetylneuraminate synthase